MNGETGPERLGYVPHDPQEARGEGRFESGPKTVMFRWFTAFPPCER